MIKQNMLDKATQRLVDWIRDEVTKAGATGGVFGLSGGADSALVAILTKRAFPDNAVGVLMPCHSSQNSLDRANELARSIDLKTFTVDLSKAHESITSQISVGFGVDHKMAMAGLRSCLRAPTLDYVAKLHNALIIGTGNRDEDEVARYYQKRGDGAVDISPIAKLHKSEVYQLLRHLGCPQSIIDAKPTADLWGPDSGQEDEKELGISYAEMEWAISENDGHEVIKGEWVNLERFLTYSPRQVEVIKKLRSMERASRHKIHIPVFDIRWEGEVFEGNS